MTTRIQTFAPVKVNLYLEVLARRRDGFHEIDTVLETLDFGDHIQRHFFAGPPGQGLRVGGGRAHPPSRSIPRQPFEELDGGEETQLGGPASTA